MSGVYQLRLSVANIRKLIANGVLQISATYGNEIVENLVNCQTNDAKIRCLATLEKCPDGTFLNLHRPKAHQFNLLDCSKAQDFYDATPICFPVKSAPYPCLGDLVQVFHKEHVAIGSVVAQDGESCWVLHLPIAINI